jgi:hypothetical protein
MVLMQLRVQIKIPNAPLGPPEPNLVRYPLDHGSYFSVRIELNNLYDYDRLISVLTLEYPHLSGDQLVSTSVYQSWRSYLQHSPSRSVE